MLHRIEIYRESYSSIKAKDSEFNLSLLQTIESEALSAAIDFGINFMRSEFEFADLTADDLNVGNFSCSDPSGLKRLSNQLVSLWKFQLRIYLLLLIIVKVNNHLTTIENNLLLSGKKLRKLLS